MANKTLSPRTALLAFAAPLLVFMLLAQMKSLLPDYWEHVDRVWWQRAPEHWIYPIQCLLTGAWLVWFWKHYNFQPLNIKVITWSVIAGAVGIAWWLLPGILGRHFGWTAWQEPRISFPLLIPDSSAWELLGIADRKDGFNPNEVDGQGAQVLTLVLRFIRAAVIVALVEEIFWRGFLMRYVCADGEAWWTRRIGEHQTKAMWITVGAFVLLHQHVDWLGAIGYGFLAYALAIKTRSLGACVIMHGVANFLMGVYICYSGQWGYW